MKIQHKTRTSVARIGGDIVDSAYMAEVEASTARLEREYARAEKRLNAAIAKAQKAEARTGTKPAVVADLWAVVELRRMELDRYARMMATSPASAQHRGGKSFRPVPVVMNGSDR